MPSASSTELAVASPAPIGQAREITDREQRIVSAIMREFSQYQSRRANFAEQWEEVANLILPTSRNTFYFQNYNAPGQKKTQQQVDATGALALHRFCAIADSLVTPRNMQWHGLQGDDYVMKDRDTRLWFENTTKLLFRMRYAATANFAAQNYNNWQSLGAFGNATMYIDKFDNRWHGGGQGFRYKAVPLGETYFGENHQGKVDRMIRWFRLTAYQAAQKWGEAALPEALRTALAQDSQYTYSFLHCVKPRGDDYDPMALDERAFPFSSHYISMEGKCLMQAESGYRVFPFAVSRYDQAPNEVEGRGPAQIVLPSLKTLNAQKIVFLKTGHRAADPVLLLADDGLVGMNLRPGAQNKGGVTSEGKPLVHVLPTGDIKISLEMMQEERGIIDDVFLVSLFKVLSEHPDMTATQVIELVNEKGMLVAPTLGRQHTEYVGGMVPRELDLAAEMRMLDPVPPRLREAIGRNGLSAIGIKDTSPLAEAANAGKAAGFMRTIESVKELVNITGDRSLLFPFAFKRAIPAISQIQNVPTDWMSTTQEVANQEKALAQSQQRQEQIQALPAQAAMLKAQATVSKNQPGIAPGQAFGGPQQSAA